jgi:hypothetical protein
VRDEFFGHMGYSMMAFFKQSPNAFNQNSLERRPKESVANL